MESSLGDIQPTYLWPLADSHPGCPSRGPWPRREDVPNSVCMSRVLCEGLLGMCLGAKLSVIGCVGTQLWWKHKVFRVVLLSGHKVCGQPGG